MPPIFKLYLSSQLSFDWIYFSFRGFMRMLNIIGLTVGLALLGASVICVISEYFLGQNAQFVAMPLCLMLALSSRRLVEKALGYTTLEAMRNEESK